MWALEDGSPQRPHWAQGSPSYWDVTSIRVYPRLAGNGVLMKSSGLYSDLLQAAAFPLREGPSACQPHPEARRACLDRVLSGGGPPRPGALAGAISGGIGQVSSPPSAALWRRHCRAAARPRRGQGPPPLCRPPARPALWSCTSPGVTRPLAGLLLPASCGPRPIPHSSN